MSLKWGALKKWDTLCHFLTWKAWWQHELLYSFGRLKFLMMSHAVMTPEAFKTQIIFFSIRFHVHDYSEVMSSLVTSNPKGFFERRRSDKPWLPLFLLMLNRISFSLPSLFADLMIGLHCDVPFTCFARFSSSLDSSFVSYSSFSSEYSSELLSELYSRFEEKALQALLDILVCVVSMADFLIVVVSWHEMHSILLISEWRQERFISKTTWKECLEKKSNQERKRNLLPFITRFSFSQTLLISSSFFFVIHDASSK